VLIKRVQIKNFTIHRDLDLVFGPGINGIVGTNGSGKSSVLDAIRFAITGTSIGDGGKTDNVTFGETQGRVVVQFEHGDSAYTIRRDFGKKNAQMLQKPDGTVIDKLAEIDAFIEGLLGTTIQSLLENVFVPQGAIESILFSTTTKRLKEIQQIVGLQRAADAEKALGAELGRYNVTIGLKEQLDSAEGARKASKVALQSKVDELEKLRGDVEKLRVSEAFLNGVLAAQANNGAIKQATARVKSTGTDLKEAEEARERVAADLKLVEETVEALAPLAETARKQIITAEAHRHNADRVKELKKQLEEAQAGLVKIGEAPSEEDVAKAESKHGTIATALRTRTAQLNGTMARPEMPGEKEALEAQAKAEEAYRELRKIDPTVDTKEDYALLETIKRKEADLKTFESGTCPTCHQPVANFDVAAAKVEIEQLTVKLVASRTARRGAHEVAVQAAIEARRQTTTAVMAIEDAAKSALKKVVERLTSEESEARAHLTRLQAQLSAWKNLTSRADMFRGQLGSVKDGPLDDVDTSALQKCVDDHQTAKLRCAELRNSLGHHVQSVGKAKQEYDGARAALEQLGRLAELPSEEEVAKAKQDCAALATRSAEFRAASDDVSMLEVREQQYAEAVARLKRQMEAEAKDAAWVGLVKRTREALHVNGLPSMLMREYAAVLNRRMAYYLRLWEAPFVMSLDDDLAFVAEFNDGMVLSAGRLSGGQKIVGATSFRFTMADTFARQVGLLILDEPSNYLDKDNVVHLQQLLLKLKDLAGSTGKQIILVTHEESLKGFFDRSIVITSTPAHAEE
jgi:DNA repair exonuclease SbcCD ATPase subunit